MVFSGLVVVLVERADRQSAAGLGPIFDGGGEEWRLAFALRSRLRADKKDKEKKLVLGAAGSLRVVRPKYNLIKSVF